MQWPNCGVHAIHRRFPGRRHLTYLKRISSWTARFGNEPETKRKEFTEYLQCLALGFPSMNFAPLENTMITHNAAAGSDLMANSTTAKIGVLVGVKHPFRSAL